MRQPQPLHSGRLIKRYKRFLADVRLDSGQIVTAHCADPGRLPGLAVEDAEVWLSKSDDPKRKLAYRLEVIRQADHLVGLNTANANKLAHEALVENRIPALACDMADVTDIRREVVYAEGTRFDFALTKNDNSTLWLEVKNVTWNDNGILAFPDAVTARGAKHLERLAEIADGGGAAALLFVAQRTDSECLRIASEIDLKYANAFQSAQSAGVRMFGTACQVDLTEIVCAKPLRIVELQR